MFFDIKSIFFILLFFIIVFPKIPLISTNYATPIRLEDLIIFYLWALLMINILIGQIKIYKNMIFFWIGIYLSWGSIATVLGFYRGDVSSLLFFLRKIEYISLFFFSYIIINKKNIVKFYKLIFVSFGLVALIGFLQYFKFFDLIGISKYFIPYLQLANRRFWQSSLVSSTFDGNYDLGGYLILIVPFFLLLLVESNYFNKKFLFTNFLSAVILVFISGARTPIVIIGFFILFIFLKKLFLGKKKNIYKTWEIFIVSFFIFIFFKNNIFQNFLQRMNQLKILNYENVIKFIQTDNSFGYRITKWSKVWHEFLSHPLFGRGIGGFSEHFISADGQHIQTLGETGLVGFILFLVLFFYVIKMISNTKRHLNKIPCNRMDDLNRIFISALSIGILGLLVNGITINIFDSSKVAMCLWAFIGVAAKLNSMYRIEMNNIIKNT